MVRNVCGVMYRGYVCLGYIKRVLARYKSERGKKRDSHPNLASH